MKITVVVDDLVNEIEGGLDSYEKEYKKLLKLYREKQERYMEYLENHIEKIENGESPTDLKYPPSAPSWLRNNFIDILEALKAHRQNTIVMDDREYTEARHGIARLREDITSSTESLNSISY